eukprot:12407159-Karenia_brevis.AAC.1
MQRRAEMRRVAATAFHEFDCSEAVRRAYTARSRPYRGDYSPGEKVKYWRVQRKARDGKLLPPGWINATVIGEQQ